MFSLCNHLNVHFSKEKTLCLDFRTDYYFASFPIAIFLLASTGKASLQEMSVCSSCSICFFFSKQQHCRSQIFVLHVCVTMVLL